MVIKPASNFLLLVSIFFVQLVHGQGSYNKEDTIKTTAWTSKQFTLHYPKKAAENNIHGAVVVSFDIDTTCSIVNVRLVKGIGYGCDEEAVKAMQHCKLIYPKGQGKQCTPRQNILQTFNFSNPDGP